MTLLNETGAEFNTAIIAITHDLGVVAGICDKARCDAGRSTMEYVRVMSLCRSSVFDWFAECRTVWMPKGKRC